MFTRHQAPGGPDWFDFSFSGLKTSVLTRVRDLERQGRLAAETRNLAASFQRAVIDVLVGKTMRAVAWTGCHRVVLGGGVSASRALRWALADALGPAGRLFAPGPRLATDNAAMVASAAWFHFEREGGAGPDITARADRSFPGLVRRATGGVE
jgi:N6-L-threonylcarbamoyladenine synthase